MTLKIEVQHFKKNELFFSINAFQDNVLFVYPMRT